MAPPRILVLLAFIGLAVVARESAAQGRLPYAVRTLSFGGLGTSVHGDLRTVGMGGASAGLADTFFAALDDPAGLAMTVGVGDIHYATDSIQDKHLQSFDAVLHTESVGLALGLYPWAIGIGFVQPYREQADYALPDLVPSSAALSVTTRELVFSAARVLWHNRLSIGVSLVLGEAVRDVQDTALHVDQSYISYTAGAVAGAMVRLPHRILIGTGFALPMHYAGAQPDAQRMLAVPGFFQPVEVPWRLSLGIGWIINRFLRTDFTVHLLGATPNTALVRDEAALVGQGVTLQPHVGVAYVFANYHEFKGTLFLGTYYEWTRIAGTGSREHGTGGVEARIWIFTVGGGVDLASGYQNVLLTFGADVFGILARLEVIPTAWIPPYGGMLPRPDKFSDVGLARPLVKNWSQQGPEVDPIEIAIKIPSKLGLGFKNAGKELEHIGVEIGDVLEIETEKQRLEREKAVESIARAKEQQRQQDLANAEEARLAQEAKEAETLAAAEAEIKAQAAARRRRERRRRSKRLAAPSAPIATPTETRP